MVFRKRGSKKGESAKGRMIDVGELYRRGKISSPEKEDSSKKGFSNEGGFVDVSKSGGSFSSSSKVSSNEGCYSKKEVDSRIEKLDGCIYKLEQRLEVLERKLGVDSSRPTSRSSGSSVGGAFNAVGL